MSDLTEGVLKVRLRMENRAPRLKGAHNVVEVQYASNVAHISPQFIQSS